MRAPTHTHTPTQNYRNGYVFEWRKQVWVSTPLCFCAMGFALWSKSIVKLLVTSNHSILYQKKRLAFLNCVPPRILQAFHWIFLEQKKRDTVCTNSNHQSSSIWNLLPVLANTVRWNAPPPSGPVASEGSVARAERWSLCLNGWATRTPTVQQHTGLEVMGLLCPVVTDGTHVWRLPFWRTYPFLKGFCSLLLHHAPAQWSPCNDLACRRASSNTLPQVPQEKGVAWDHVSLPKKAMPESPNMFRYPRWRYENPM